MIHGSRDPEFGRILSLYEKLGLAAFLLDERGWIQALTPRGSRLIDQSFDLAIDRPLTTWFVSKSGARESWPTETAARTPVRLTLPGQPSSFRASTLRIAVSDTSTMFLVVLEDDASTPSPDSVEARLLDSESRYRMLVENAPIGFVLMAPGGQVLDMNQEMVRVLGLASREAARINLLDHPSVVASGLADDFARCLATRQSIFSDRVYAARAQESLRLRCRLTLAVSFDGSVTGVQGLVEDITATEQAEAKRAQLEEQLLQSQKMEAIGRLAGGVAHDFNNILTGIIGYADGMVSMLDPADPLRTDAEEIRSAGQRAAGLTRQLLAFSRKQIICPRVVVLDEIIAQSRNMLGRIIGEDIDLAFHPESEGALVRLDPQQLDQILVNLAVNARDAMPAGGSLQIQTRTALVEAGAPELDEDMQSTEYAVIIVSDTGHGMSPEIQSHVFEPFFSTKGHGKGTGLGLATVYGIVKQNGGSIRVESRPEEGTSFRILLPRIHGKGPDTDRTSTDRPPRHHATVLLVEDDSMVRRLTSKLLKRQGHAVLEASDVSDALSRSAQHEAPIDLLLVDVVMPGMNGRELFEALAEHRPTLKVLYMSGYPDNVLGQHGVLDAGTSVLQKPFTPTQLASTVQEVLDGGFGCPTTGADGT